MVRENRQLGNVKGAGKAHRSGNARLIRAPAVLRHLRYMLLCDRHISQYERTAWRGQDGVFSGSPNAISQTTDGYLRIGTQAGLVKSACLAYSAWKVTILGLLAGDSGYLLISSPKLWEEGTAVWRFRPPLFARRCRQVIRVLNFLNTSETIEFILDFSTGDAGWVNICELRSVGF